MLRNQWYAILSAHELPPDRPLGVTRFGQPLVFWRDHGQVCCVSDICPHLGAALSGGKICQGKIQCPFHGFEFQGDGQCTHIPANGPEGRIPKGMVATAYVVREAHGLIWLWWGDPQTTYPPLPMFAELDDNWVYGTQWATWPVHFTRAVENQLDMAHIPFVHRTTIGAGGRTRIQGPWVEAKDHQIRVWTVSEKETGQPQLTQEEVATRIQGKPPSLQFRFGNIWLLQITPEIRNFIAFVPISETETGYILRFYKKVRGPRWLNQAMAHAAGLSNRLILNQDKRVVVTQVPAQTQWPSPSEHFIGADRAILQFRKMYHRDPSETPLPMASESPIVPTAP